METIGRITGMIIELPDHKEIIENLENPSVLNSRIEEALKLFMTISNNCENVESLLNIFVSDNLKLSNDYKQPDISKTTLYKILRMLF